MVGPKKQFDQEEVLNKALQVFWNKGFEATSMQDLVRTMGINRASLYQTYGNKRLLFNKSLDRYIDNMRKQLNQILQLPGSPLDNLQDVLKKFVTGSLDAGMQGCLLNNTAVELGPHDPEIATKLRNIWDEFEMIFSKIIQHAVDNGEIKSSIDVTTLGHLFNINLQGLVVETKINTSKEKLLISIDLLFDLIKN